MRTQAMATVLVSWLSGATVVTDGGTLHPVEQRESGEGFGARHGGQVRKKVAERIAEIELELEDAKKAVGEKLKALSKDSSDERKKLESDLESAAKKAERKLLQLKDDLAEELRRSLDGYSGAAASIGNGTSVIEASGPQARRFLAKGTAIDLHPGVFAIGRCAVTGFGKVRVTLWRLEADRYALLIGRSFARSVWDWAVDGAREWGR